MQQAGLMRAGAARPVGQVLPPKDQPVRALTLNQFFDGPLWRRRLIHDRDDHLLLWITRGQGIVTVDGVRRGVSAHNALYLPAGTLMSIDLPQQTLGQVILATRGASDLLPDTAFHLRVRDSLAQSELTAEIDALTREQVQGRAFMDEAMAARLGPIGVWLRRQDLVGASDAPPQNAARRLVHRFARLVVEEFRTTLTMAHFAERLEVTPTHLARVCRECCGKTAADLLTERRLHAAQSALLETDAPVKSIANDLGFQSPAYFTRFIQQHTGASPTAYRQNGHAPKR